MDHELLGWPPDGPKLRLDHERFGYAGKFVMTTTGKAVSRDGGEIVAAVAFDEDRTEPSTLRLRYVTVARDRHGEGIAPSLVSFVRERAGERGYDRLAIAVNNPYAYEALSRAGFAYTGETTGLAELVLERPVEGWSPDRDVEGGSSDDDTGERTDDAGAVDEDRYRAGLRAFRDRELTDEEAAFVRRRLERGRPGPPD